ncbi:hypothetical protein BJY01DRAFT_209467 [Aspergillus pseudoustus]|uniref:F-box domain-containing protein n=1 Tax=Aspergillus pseudoustus TaxID=1810923 RepID=A0ABR4KFW2_9EURO
MTSSKTLSADSYFTKLPPELITGILAELPDLESVHSVISTCSRLCTVYQASQLRVISLVFHRRVYHDSDHGIYRALQMLKFIITQKIIQRDVALFIFKTAWPLFAAKEREQMLFPFGRALAWSFAKNEKQLDAVQILQDIWKEGQPFSWKMTKHTPYGRPLTLLPLEMLLRQLQCEKQWPIETTSTLDTVSIATITQTEVRWDIPITSICKSQQDFLLRTGILFTEGGIHILFSVDAILSVTQVPCQLPVSGRQ